MPRRQAGTRVSQKEKNRRLNFLNSAVTRQIRADYSETYLFPPVLEDWVGADHPARFIRGVVDELDLEELGLRAERKRIGNAGQGRPHYGAELLLKAWLYGYLNHLRSPRRLEGACQQPA